MRIHGCVIVKSITMKIINLLIRASLAVPYLYDRVLATFYRRAMRHCGEGVYLRPSCSDIKGLENLSIGGGYKYTERINHILY